MLSQYAPSLNSEKVVVAECLISLGFQSMADHALKTKCPKVYAGYVNHAVTEARTRNAHDVIERLEFEGLIYPSRGHHE